MKYYLLKYFTQNKHLSQRPIWNDLKVWKSFPLCFQTLEGKRKPSDIFFSIKNRLLPHKSDRIGRVTSYVQLSSVQFSRSVVSDSFQPHASQHTRPPCPSPTPRVHSDSHPSRQWRHPAISSSVVPFSTCPQSLPASESFPMSQLFAWGGQTKYWSFSFSIIPSKEHPGLISFRMDWLDLLIVQGILKSLL